MNYHQLFALLKSPFKLFNQIRLQSPWWVKIATNKPQCVYYFGPFDNQQEALESQSGYIEDLETEKAKGIVSEIKRERPRLLTICKE